MARAVIGWLPIAFGIGWIVGELTGCGRFAATCDGSADPLVLILQVAVLALLLVVPVVASIATMAALALFAAAIVAALILSATGSAADGDSRRAALGAVLLVAWFVGLAVAVMRRLRTMSVTDPSRILTRCPDATISATCHPRPRSTCSRCGSWAAPTIRQVTAAQVARHLGVTTQAASEMFRRLVADGLVEHAEGRELHLTTAGRAAADAIFRRHALLEWLLTSVVGLGWAESDDEAMRLQGAISPRVEARLDEMLGHPETCPHGNPIDAETARRRPAGIRLSEMEAGSAPRSTGSPRRPRRMPACCPTSRRAR